MKRGAQILRCAFVGLIAGAFSVTLYLSGLMDRFELDAADLRYELAADPERWPEDIVMIYIDQSSLDWMADQPDEQIVWPWPRYIHTSMAQFLKECDARVVVLDFLMSETSVRTSEDDKFFAETGKDLDFLYLGCSGVTKDALEEVKQGGELQEILKYRDRPPGPASMKAWSLKMKDAKGLLEFGALTGPVPDLEPGLAGIGITDTFPDRDGVIRKYALTASYKGQVLPSLALAAYLHGRSEETGIGESGLRIGELRIPVDAEGLTLLHPYSAEVPRSQQFSYATMVQLAREWLETGEVPEREKKRFGNKYIIFGAHATGLFDYRPTSLDTRVPGVNIHAMMLSNLIRGEFRRRAGTLVPLLWSLILALAIGAGIGWLRIEIAVAASIGLILLSLILNILIFVKSLLWVDLMPVLLSGVLSFAGVAAYSYFTEGRQKLQVKRVFQNYVSPKVVNKVLDRPDVLSMKGERKKLTVFFLDFEGFTSASENLDPEVLLELVNQYHSEAVDEIFMEEGTLDKFIGDAIMAFWGDPVDQPDQAQRACRAAVRIQKRLHKMAGDMHEKGLVEFRARIGINTGEATVGNTGGKRQFNYSVIGDEVNLASRLEGVNKEFGTSILVSDGTKQSAGDVVGFRKLGSVTVKGRKTPVGIHEVMEEMDEKTAERVRTFEGALELFTQRKWDEAERIFAGLAEKGDPPSKLYVRLCNRYREKPPPDGWQGEYVMEKK